MDSNEIRQKFLEFFKNRGHTIIPSASLVPENDSSVLFTTAGMQPLVPYLMGEKHPSGTRLVNVQKCVRTQDIEEIGDNTHNTFFEMLGNWSLGDYFKEEAIKWSFEFLTDKKEGLGLDSKRLYITCFEGDSDAPKDEESADIWKKLGIPEHRIYFLGKDSNWWSPGDNGPCGPDTEMFYDVTEKGLGDLDLKEFIEADDKQEVVEIWNDVFMEYEKKDGKIIGKLKQKNVDTGAGLERLAMVMQKKDNIFDTDLFEDLIKEIRTLSPIWKSGTYNLKSERIVVDHIRTAVFMVSDGVLPSNKDRGYILRRLIRRAVLHANKLEIENYKIINIVTKVIGKYSDVYENLVKDSSKTEQVILQEESNFMQTLKRGLKELEKLPQTQTITGPQASVLVTTYGFPIEMIMELRKDVDLEGYKKEMEKHKEISRKGAEKKFKGGLADTSEMSIKYHTATHLLQQALRDILGEHIYQKGSNITPERLRFDFSYDEKLTDEQKQKVEDIVNDKIKQSLPVTYEDISLEDAKKKGAIGLFEEKYEDKVRVYSIGNYSLEYCGGPHVKNTSELGKFKIKKEESTSKGVRRIKAILE